MSEDIKDVLKRGTALARQLEAHPTILIEFSTDMKNIKATFGDMPPLQITCCHFTEAKGIVLIMEPIPKNKVLAATNIPGAKQ